MRRPDETKRVKSTEQDFRARCAKHLAERWTAIVNMQGEPSFDYEEPLSNEPELASHIRDTLTSNIVTYHYVLPTQVLAKVVDPSLDARCVQVGSGFIEAFDARSLAHNVIVPFDQANSNVLGGSTSPYINNPLRVRGIVPEFRSAQKNKTDWDKLVAVLDLVQNVDDPDFTGKVFDQVLLEIYRLLEGVVVSYPTPSRISLGRTQHLLERFLGEKSGGDRSEVVTTALMRTIGERFSVFTSVRRERVNSADRSSGMSGDIECIVGEDVVLMVEVKEQHLTLVHINSKLEMARSRRVQEILFVAQNGIETDEKQQIDSLVESEFTSGQNVYIENLTDFSLGVLVLLGEKGRVAFLREVGGELDRNNSGIQHRKAWANLLKSV